MKINQLKFNGFLRDDGKVGTRNYVAVLPVVFCANTVARKIASNVQSAVAFNHYLGCGYPGYDQELLSHILIQIAKHPNFGAVLFVGLGCERVKASQLLKNLGEIKKPIEVISIQDEGDTLKTIEKGTKIALDFSNKLQRIEPQPVGLENLILGVKCGGTDAASGIAANPALGRVSDLIVEAGGTVLITELTELLGAENIILNKAVNQDVADKISLKLKLNYKRLQRLTRSGGNMTGTALVSPGNAEGGVSTVAEKALGGFKKAGNSQIQGVIEYCQSVKGKGLFLMDGPGHDGESVTGLICAGAQLVVFTTGRGTPAGFPGVPVFKVTGNSETFNKMKVNLDFNAADIIEKRVAISNVGEQMLKEILNVASGKLTKSELLGHDELFCISRFMSHAGICEN